MKCREHDFMARGVTDAVQKDTKFPVTVVLYVCTQCGSAMTENLLGAWTIDQLLAPAHMSDKQREQIITDLQRLRSETR